MKAANGHFFKIEGYALEDGKEPIFEGIGVMVNGSYDVSYGGSFYNGVHYDDEKGIFVYDADGSSAEDADGTVMERFADEDGSLEYILRIFPSGVKGEPLSGSTAHIVFCNLGTIYNKVECKTDLEAEWAFDISLQGSDQVRNVTLSEPLGDSGATVISAEISPISITINYDFPIKEVAIEGVDENGNPIMASVNEQPPELTGVRLKDGTLLPGTLNAGMTTWDESMKICIASHAANRILDTKQIDALLFIKEYPDTNRRPTAEELYIVPIE